LVLHQQASERLVEDVTENNVRDGQEQAPTRVSLGQDRPIQNILASGLLQVVDFRVPEEALDLHVDPPLTLLGSQELLGAQVNVHVLLAPR
jgi:hypothetical protein